MNNPHIIVGSQLGATEYVADEIEQWLSDNNITATIHTSPDLNDIPTENAHWILCTSTHGAGDLPDNIEPFYQQLNDQQPNLNSVKCWLIGIGDTSYDTYNQAAKTFQQRLISLNVQLQDHTFIDVLSDDLPETIALSWFKRTNFLDP